MTDATEEIEVNFRLDTNGRTALSPTDSENNYTNPVCIDYTTNCSATHFVDPAKDDNAVGVDESQKSLYDELLFDCEICDSALMPRTFWVPAPTATNDTAECFTPRCTLEQMARDIFDQHTQNKQQLKGKSSDYNTNKNTTEPCGSYYDPTTSGAEWWVQLRPSPESTGRYAVLSRQSGDVDAKNDNANTGDEDIETNGISFHWDKDEDLRLLAGGSIYVHPHLSTVTYLTAIGAPTLIIEGCRINNLTGEWLDPAIVSAAATVTEPSLQTNDAKEVALTEGTTLPNVTAFVSWPFPGKHLCFDGRYLHAAPSNLQPAGTFRQQCSFVPTPDLDTKVQQRRYRRCTFLVNIWLNHKPLNVNPFPDTMIDKLSGYIPTNDPEKGGGNNPTVSQRMRLSFDRSDGSDERTRVKAVTVRPDSSLCIHDSETTDDSTNTKVEDFNWPLGGHESREFITTTVPVTFVQSLACAGGNVRIQWEPQESYLSGKHRPGDVGLYLIKEEIQVSGTRQKESLHYEDEDLGACKRRRHCDK